MTLSVDVTCLHDASVEVELPEHGLPPEWSFDSAAGLDIGQISPLNLYLPLF